MNKLTIIRHTDNLKYLILYTHITLKGFESDSENIITKNTNDIMQYMIQHRYAVYVYNLALLLKIYLHDITAVEELTMFRNEISSTVISYRNQYEEMAAWVKMYLEETNCLNKMSVNQMLLMVGSAVFVGVLSRDFASGGQVASKVNNLFKDNRDKKKESFVARNKDYQTQMSDMDLIESSIEAMDNYIEFTGRKAEIVSVEGEYFIKYIIDK